MTPIEKPNVLFHGSSRLITGHIEPHQATDRTNPHNGYTAVYATERRDIALGMSLTSGPGHAGFGNFNEVPFTHVFIHGEPQRQSSYLYTLSPETFEPAGAYQWVSHVPVPILRVDEFQPGELSEYWRRATPEEVALFWQRQRSNR